MGKSAYKNLVTIPTSSEDTIVSTPNTGVGGDIVANFKAIADVINPEKPANGIQALNVGCNFNYASSSGKSYHILNNTGSYVGASALASSSSSNVAYGLSSGAFMKGVLANPQTANTVTLLDVPYAGGMLVEANVLFIDNYSQLHIHKETLYVYPDGIRGDCNLDIGYFDVSNGDLIFSFDSSIASLLTAVQFGLHGTILAGYSYAINAGQSDSTVFETSTSSSSSSYESTS